MKRKILNWLIRRACRDWPSLETAIGVFLLRSGVVWGWVGNQLVRFPIKRVRRQRDFKNRNEWFIEIDTKGWRIKED